MKLKKTTAPSDSQRDSQDWKEEFYDRFEIVMDESKNDGSEGYKIMEAWSKTNEKIKDFIQQEIDKSFQAGFQEAVESIMEMGDIALKESDNQQDFMIRFFDRLRNMSDLLGLVKTAGEDHSEDNLDMIKVDQDSEGEVEK